MARGEEAGPPVIVVERLITGPLHLRDEHDVVGQVALGEPRPVADPGPHAGTAGELAAREQERHGRGVVDVIGVHRLDEAEVVHHRAEMRSHSPTVAPLAVPAERNACGHERAVSVRLSSR